MKITTGMEKSLEKATAANNSSIHYRIVPAVEQSELFSSAAPGTDSLFEGEQLSRHLTDKKLHSFRSRRRRCISVPSSKASQVETTEVANE